MKNELMYSFRDNNVRVVIKDAEPWFVLKDVCEILEVKNHNEVLNRIKDNNKGVDSIYTLGGNQNMSIINEAGLYEIIFSSRKEQALNFKDWVFEEVLPSIRKHGIYATDDITKKVLDDPQFMIDLLQNLQKEREERKKAESTVTILTHVNKVYTSTEIAKELGLRSANALNKKLNELGIQYYQNRTWVLYSKYADKGYTQIKQSVLDNGQVVYDRKWTQLGREFLIKLITRD